MGFQGEKGEEIPLLYKNNKFHNLVDSLPFVDTVPVDLEPQIKQLVEEEMRLILEESGTSEEELLRSYIRPLEYNFPPKDNLYNKELDRIKKGIKMEKIDFDKYSTLAPEQDLKGRLNQVKMLLEFSQDSLTNLELMDRYKEGSWLKYLDSLTLLKLRMEKERGEMDSKLEELNKKRKLAQIETANRLRTINQEYEENKARNGQLLLAIEQLQQQQLPVTCDDQ